MRAEELKDIEVPDTLKAEAPGINVVPAIATASCPIMTVWPAYGPFILAGGTSTISFAFSDPKSITTVRGRERRSRGAVYRLLVNKVVDQDIRPGIGVYGASDWAKG